MPSKLGFGNSRTPMTKKVSYGSAMHYKNPIKKKIDPVPTATDTVQAGLAHEMGWMKIDEANKQDDANKSKGGGNEKTNWNLGYRASKTLGPTWDKATKSRSLLNNYKPTSEEIEKSAKNQKKNSN